MGACNIFFVIKNDEGKREVITPELDGSILPGITRKTVLEFLRKDIEERGKDAVTDVVTERKVRISEIQELFNKGRVLECFGSGTAVTIVPVQMINIKNVEHRLPISEESTGDVSNWVYKKIIDVQYGRVESPLQFVVE